jgi:hypothetical protein
MITGQDSDGKKVFLGVCRFCEHLHMSEGTCGTTSVGMKDCLCDKWGPEDNLEYLELKSKLNDIGLI